MHKLASRLAALALVLLTVLSTTVASAAGQLRVKTTTVNEQSGAWHIVVSLIQLPKAPPMRRVPMRFIFTQTAVYERARVDGKKEPVQNRIQLKNGSAKTETLDVDFSDISGKTYNQTRYDFGLSRDSGYEAGEYQLRVRTTDGMDIGQPVTLILKGDNEIVDRRTMSFEPSKPASKPSDSAAAPKQTDEERFAMPSADVEASGTAEPFVSPDAYEETDEENIKVKRGGCHCDAKGDGVELGGTAALFALASLSVLALRRRRVTA